MILARVKTCVRVRARVGSTLEQRIGSRPWKYPEPIGVVPSSRDFASLKVVCMDRGLGLGLGSGLGLGLEQLLSVDP